jgi:hypothetical protein
VIEAVANVMVISCSDASGVVEAQSIYMQQSWGRSMDARLTAAKVIEAVQEQAEERAMAPAPKQERMLFGDEADVHAFWKDKEFKTFTVDLVQGNGKKQKVIRTIYVRSRTSKVAAECAKANDWSQVLLRPPAPRATRTGLYALQSSRKSPESPMPSRRAGMVRALSLQYDSPLNHGKSICLNLNTQLTPEIAHLLAQ